MSLLDISQQLTIYAGIFIIILGIIGNGLNIFIFSTLRIYRLNPCSFYFLTGSICNIFYILINVTFRIINVGYGINLVNMGIFLCKIRTYSLITISLITLSCSCLATIDQFLVTSQNAHLRHFSQLKLAHWLVFIVISSWCLHGIPILVFYTIPSDRNACVSINSGYAIYISLCILLLISIVPVIITSVFGYLTYKNIRQTRVLAQLQVDRQFTKMILIQVAFVIICIFPYGIYSIYTLITAQISKDTVRLQNEYFASTFLSLVAYFYYAGHCYIFLISSSRFRRSVMKTIFCWKRENQIHPL